ncbi:Sec-independent protein translocase protein TatB [Desulfovibrio ferrophilus]|uniref:Twin-arginine translocation protein subunit TatB n=1 Tax=Desulfovibrio ferrophilus TaxID=241368 RepID=A0A2Z6AYQ4_9BACT|nr:Sec-independent protein translocase protein TatB [Desulfovibrio ferrophilus]BBD08358.1 twin-arginine translocation protein subunit TatB [Desulfovibrio ferrophilus]
MELLVIFVVALIVIGPRKLPQMARSMGKAFGEFKRVSADVKRTIDTEVDKVERQEKKVKAKSELMAEDAAASMQEKSGSDADAGDAAKTVEAMDVTPEPAATASKEA